MTSVTIQEAQANLSGLIQQLTPGEELTITDGDQPVARLISAAAQSAGHPRQPGELRGSVLYKAPDFDAPLDDFREYMDEAPAGKGP
jgi:antitoxin (DNA-binding transcriptional repressor) of toxin-antitoxin stability system